MREPQVRNGVTYYPVPENDNLDQDGCFGCVADHDNMEDLCQSLDCCHDPHELNCIWVTVDQMALRRLTK